MSRQRFEVLIDDWTADRLTEDQRVEFDALISSDQELRDEAEMLRSFVHTMRSDQLRQKAPAGLLAGALEKARSSDQETAQNQAPLVVPVFPKKSATVVEASGEQSKKEKAPWGFYLMAASLGAVAVLSANLLIQNRGNQQSQVAKVNEQPHFDIVEKTPIPYENTVEYAMMTASAQKEGRTSRSKGDSTPSNERLKSPQADSELKEKSESTQASEINSLSEIEEAREESPEAPSVSSKPQMLASADSEPTQNSTSESEDQTFSDEIEIASKQASTELAMARDQPSTASNSNSFASSEQEIDSDKATFEHGIEIVAQATPRALQLASSAPSLFDEKTIGFLSNQARESNGFMVGSATTGNARLSENHGIEIVGQPSKDQNTRNDSFTVAFANEAEVEEFFLRIKSVPVSTSSTEGEELVRRNAMQFPGANALFGNSSQTTPTKRVIVSSKNLDLTQFAVVTEVDEETSMIHVTLKPYHDGEKRLDSYFPEETSSQTPKRY